MNKRNMKSREYNCPCVALLKNTLAPYDTLVRYAAVKELLTFFHAF